MDMGETIKRIKFFEHNKLKVFIKDRYDTFYFAKDLKFDIKDNRIYFLNFDGKRKGRIDKLLTIDIEDIKEYKDE